MAIYKAITTNEVKKIAGVAKVTKSKVAMQEDLEAHVEDESHVTMLSDNHFASTVDISEYPRGRSTFGVHVWSDSGWPAASGTVETLRIDDGRMTQNFTDTTRANPRRWYRIGHWESPNVGRWSNWQHQADRSWVENLVRDSDVLRSTILDLRHLNVNTYYPVRIPLLWPTERNTRIEIERFLSSDGVWQVGGYGFRHWWTHNSGFGARVIWETTGNAWGSLNIRRRVLDATFSFLQNFNQAPIRHIHQHSQGSNEMVYLRGGSQYRFRISRDIVPVLHSTGFTHPDGNFNAPIVHINNISQLPEITVTSAFSIPVTFDNNTSEDVKIDTPDIIEFLLQDLPDSKKQALATYIMNKREQENNISGEPDTIKN